MKRVLVTGMSATGKSTLIVKLAARGYKTADMDDDGRSMYTPDGEWVWREDRARELLAADGVEVLFVAGCASNQWQFYPQFDHIVLLYAPQEVIVRRLATRTTNPFGKDPQELARVLDDLANIEPQLRRIASAEIDATQPIEDVVAAVLSLVEGA